MPSSKPSDHLPPGAPPLAVTEEHLEYRFIGRLQNLKYHYGADIRDRAALERNCRDKFEALNRVRLRDGEAFKAAALLKDDLDIQKRPFVVDRKDLDRQTRQEFNRFLGGGVEKNINTAALVRRFLSATRARSAMPRWRAAPTRCTWPSTSAARLKKPVQPTRKTKPN